ncbi:methionine--tRNA ligase [Spiroplasma endosymbiont of Labia minor]|uniref:methionine--tRNA ligase n=1 Tax=Spiroplasma endosymbiont of Labia minor TaxID=3066305 RepID=UPI0030CA98FD
MQKKYFYVTTPIYYPSGNLHIGHAYTTTLADILSRYKKIQNFETFFLTGSDEHGQKIEKKAIEMQLSPQEYVDKVTANFKILWEKLNIDYSKFIRTTDIQHIDAVKKIFTNLYNKDLIYKGQYDGIYCVTCEEFLTSSQISSEGFCIISGDKPQLIKEDTYFLRVSKFQEFLTELLKTNFLIPESRRKEMLKNFIEPGLEDLSVTRITLEWGIPINEDLKHVIYVWLDALSNYITALGYNSSDDSLFKKFWSNDAEIVQLVGKEITRFHSIYWPVILKSLDLRLPDKLLSHGWILFKNAKMSKSLGNVINPLDLIEKFESDTLRFYIAHELPTNRDGNYSEDLIIESYNTHLANNFGNLASRVSNMIIKYFDGELIDTNFDNSEIFKFANETIDKFQTLMNNYDISEAVHTALLLGQHCNKIIEEIKPWNLFDKKKYDELKNFLAAIRYCITAMTLMLKPILVNKIKLFAQQFGYEQEKIDFSNLNTIKFEKITDKLIIFKRI